MNPQGGDLLSQLRDIHAAPSPPWWPPAPGWWVLALLALLLATFLLHRGWRAWQRRARRRRSLQWVDEVARQFDPETAPQAFLAAINRVFKVVALSAFPDQRCARLQGRQWVEFLQTELGGHPEAGQLDALASGPYQPAPRFDPEAIGRLARTWIQRHG